MMNWHFAEPQNLFLLLGLLPWGWYEFLNQKRKLASLQFSNLDLTYKDTPQKNRLLPLRLPLALKFLSLAFLIIALARPQSMDARVKRNLEGIDIMVVLDISDSMLIEDMKPLNRLESAKATIENFVHSRVSDRIGVIIFAGESFTIVPLTLDYDLLLKRVSEIQTANGARIKDGTAIGVALANGAARLKDSVAKSRIMIFLTDGENNSGTIDPETGLQIVKGYGIKVYSVGIGKDGPTRIPVYVKDVFGNSVKTYQPFDSTVNEDLLGRMASDTGGKYYRAQEQNSLGEVFNDINSLERTKIEDNKFVHYEEHFQIFLLLAFIFLTTSFILDRMIFWRLP